MTNRFMLAPIAAAALAGLAVTPAAAQTRVGALECNVSGGPGFVITSAKALACVYTDPQGRVERYVGTIQKFGLDVGFTGPGRMVWGVFAPSAPGRGALAGDYAGVQGSVTAGVGVGANALIGGSNRTISLQPVSVEAQSGVNLSAGVGAVSLEYVPPR